MNSSAFYAQQVREIYGADETCHPVWPPNLTFSFSGGTLANEVAVRAMGRGADCMARRTQRQA
jgi:hypothetical protein